jgi:D-sedoheptulose 7-phosphate isomerase
MSVVRANIGRLEQHVDEAVAAVRSLYRLLPTVSEWADRLVQVLTGGGRVLVAGNGGSAALAQHLTSELVGRFQEERPAFSALCLSAETSSLTALGNDYGFDLCFARQVEAHARPGDVLILMSTSGRSPNLLLAGDAARTRQTTVWSLTGPAPNPLAQESDGVLDVDAATTAAVQEAQQVLVHLLCRGFDERVKGLAP